MVNLATYTVKEAIDVFYLRVLRVITLHLKGSKRDYSPDKIDEVGSIKDAGFRVKQRVPPAYIVVNAAKSDFKILILDDYFSS
jgi:hypothetical protein